MRDVSLGARAVAVAVAVAGPGATADAGAGCDGTTLANVTLAASTTASTPALGPSCLLVQLTTPVGTYQISPAYAVSPRPIERTDEPVPYAGDSPCARCAC